MARPQSPHSPRENISKVSRNYLWTLCALLPLLLTYWGLQPDLLSQGMLDALNTMLPLYFIAVLMVLSWRVMGVLPASIWTALIWYPIHSAVFFGFGPMVQIFGNEITQAAMSTHFLGITDQELFRAHQLSVTGVFMALMGLNAHLTFRQRVWEPGLAETQAEPVFDTEKLGLTFLILGLSFKYLLLNPAQWGMLDLTIPGVLSSLGNFADLGFAIIAYCAARGDRRMQAILWIVLPLHVGLSVLSMAKTPVIIALLLPALGHFVGNGKVGVFLRNLVLIAMTFTLLQPWVHHGRSVISDRTGTINLANYGERVEIFSGFLLNGSSAKHNDQGEERQGWWTRLNYSGPQSQAMSLYDRGFNNSALHNAWVYFIPRAIWPEKPILIGPGRDFYRLLTGNEEARNLLGLSIYGDFYWQFGWPGVIIGCFGFGWLLGVTASRALRAVQNQEFVMLPYIMMALELALDAPSKYVLNGIIGPLPIMAFYYMTLSGVLWILRRQQTRRLSSPAGSANHFVIRRP